MTKPGNMQINDNIVLGFGNADDFTIVHDETDTIFDNTFTTGSTIFRLGTDTSATEFPIQNSSSTATIKLIQSPALVPNTPPKIPGD